MNTRALDEILGISAATPVSRETASVASAEIHTISRVCRIIGDDDGTTVAVGRTDVRTGQWQVEVIRLRADRQPGASLTLRCAPDATDRRIAAAMSGAQTAGLMLVPGGAAVALGPQWQGLAQAVSALAPGRDACLHTAAGWCALFDPATGKVHVLKDAKTPTPRLVDIEALRLGGWRRLSGLHIAGGWLYAAVADPVSGFDLCRCKLSARVPKFEPLLSRGAHRFAINAAVASMAVCDQGLLLGTAALAGSAQPVGDWGPELLLLIPEGRWDMIAGQPRFSPDGLMLPAAIDMLDMRAPRNAALMAIAHSDGRTAIAIQDFAGEPQPDRRKTTPNLFDYRGSVRLFCSDDLTNWQELGHDLPADPGPVTCLTHIPGGLLLGFAAVGAETLLPRFVPQAQPTEARTISRSGRTG